MDGPGCARPQWMEREIAVTERTQTVPVTDPMKPVDLDLADAEPFVLSADWVGEQKFDGTRGLAVVSETRVWWPGRGGRGALAHTAATQHFPKINAVLRRVVGDTPGVIVLDGEIMTGTGEYLIYDLPYARFGGVEHVGPMDPFSRRRAVLEVVGTMFAPDCPVRVVRQARTPREKLDLIKAVEAGGGEGVVLKRTDAPYEPGRRVTHQRRLKFVKTADVVVMGRTQSPNAITFGVHDSAGQLRPAGGCSMIGKPGEIAVGDVVEVAYLYWTGSSLYQPRLMRKRFDKLPGDCRADQFRDYSRAEV